MGHKHLAVITGPLHLTNASERLKGFRRALDEARERGFSIDDEEYDDGVRCIALPVGGMNDAIAAISVSAPASRFSRQRCLELVPLLRRSAAELATALRDRGDATA